MIDDRAAKNILIVHQSAELYGSDRVLIQLAEGLNAREEFHPIVVLPESGPLLIELRRIGVEVHVAEVAKLSRAAFSPRGVLGLLGKARRGLRQLDALVAGRAISVVHSNTIAVLAGALWARLRRVPHVWHVHEIIRSPSLVRRLFPFLIRLLSDFVISNSTQTEAWLLGEQPRLKKRSRVVFNGLPSLAEPERGRSEVFRETVGADADTLIVTLAGRINRWKGQSVLIEAAGILLRTDLASRLRYVIVGSAAPGLEDLPEQLRQRAQELGVGNVVVFRPFIEDVWPVWFGSDIAVVPSIEPEPFGMVAIEAMAAGLPVVAAGHGGLLDIIEEGASGLLVTPGSAEDLARAIARLARDARLRRTLGEAGRERQKEKFSATSYVEGIENVYRRFC
ncbi:glycosyltransferase family 4 protein [Niveibacterium terrae]|uniref:glycosyltransferase family 4 protein n=1 Tax=Niveibacterium terrae TaxID=3373598 RepID=UPI003A954655